MANNTSQHIIGTAANLLGLCLFVITSLHITSSTESSIIDEFVSVVALMLAFSCVFSFFSIRSKQPAKEKLFETIADYLFIISLLGIVVIILLLVFRYIH
jgi:predicted membrane channel-forming protein YqfA (hemolysin III family)